MKRSGELQRSSGLRSAGIKRGTKKLPRSNPRQVAKRKVRQAANHRAYMRSETRKIVDARANGQCEAWLDINDGWVLGMHAEFAPGLYRCLSSLADNNRLQHHHLTYARYGGNELPEDILKCCRRCHDWLEAQHPTRHLSHHGADHE